VKKITEEQRLEGEGLKTREGRDVVEGMTMVKQR